MLLLLSISGRVCDERLWSTAGSFIRIDGCVSVPQRSQLSIREVSS
jgi:hypothetical protein